MNEARGEEERAGGGGKSQERRDETNLPNPFLSLNPLTISCLPLSLASPGQFVKQQEEEKRRGLAGGANRKHLKEGRKGERKNCPLPNRNPSPHFLRRPCQSGPP